MFIVVKACFLVGLICFSFCETLVVNGPGILDPIINPSGPKSLVPVINITLAIELPQHKCCPPCNPPATCKPCPTCSPVTTCKPCPPPITCTTCPPPITCATCPVCAPPPTCPTCDSCPTTTACPTATESTSTCPPDYEKTCGDVNAIYCAKANLCVTTIFSPRNFNLALDKCSSLSTTFRFNIIGQRKAFEDELSGNCIRRAVPTMLVDDKNETIWESSPPDECYAATFNVVGDQISFNTSSEFPCESEFPFYCVADLNYRI